MKARSKVPTATASSLSLLVKASLIALVLALTGCNALTTRRDQPQPQTPGTRGTAPVTQPAPVTSPPSPTVSAPQPSAPPPASAPTFLNRELPKVGVILGPGGAKAYAHLGALRELARARIPIHAIAGLEWGAVIGGLYAVQGQVNDAEWKSFKLRENALTNESFLGGRSRATSIAALNEFLDTAYASAKIEKSKVPFACPAYWSKQDRFGWMSKGTYKEAMRACLPYPPLFSDNGGVIAAPFSVEEAASWLRSQGANLIVLVNVLAPGETLGEGLEGLLWSEIRRDLAGAKSPIVHFAVNVNTSGHALNDIAGRRALMDAGSKAASDVVNKMSSQYGF